MCLHCTVTAPTGLSTDSVFRHDDDMGLVHFPGYRIKSKIHIQGFFFFEGNCGYTTIQGLRTVALG